MTEIDDRMEKRLLREAPDAWSSWIIGNERMRRASVCIPLLKTENGYEVLFEVRSAKLAKQPGDVCFPGGKQEAGETSLTAACRELEEELHLGAEDYELLGSSGVIAAVGRLVTVYIVRLKEEPKDYSFDEVEEIFTVPMEFFADQEPEVHYVDYQVQMPDDFPFDRIHGGRNYPWAKRQDRELFYQHGRHCIWGLTAWIMKDFVDKILR